MKYKLVLFFLFFKSVGFSQHLLGSVKDKSNNPLPGANVYFDNSSLAVITGADGEFDLSINSKLNLTLVVSYIGYKTQYIKDYSFDEKLNIVLEEELNVLKEVTIHEQLFTRKEKMELFRQQFFGSTKAAKKATIKNEDEIYFTYDKATNSLYAYSDVPLEINNPYLGYAIFYDLESFRVDFIKRSISSADVKSIFYAGYSRFVEVVSDAEMLKKREKHYRGSALHFFRSLGNRELTKNKFQIYKDGLLRMPADCFALKDTMGMREVTVKKVNKELKDNEVFYNILYDGTERSRVNFSTLSFFVDYLGNYSSLEQIFLQGEFGRKRIADMLPLNYGIEN